MGANWSGRDSECLDVFRRCSIMNLEAVHSYFACLPRAKILRERITPYFTEIKDIGWCSSCRI